MWGGRLTTMWSNFSLHSSLQICHIVVRNTVHILHTVSYYSTSIAILVRLVYWKLLLRIKAGNDWTSSLLVNSSWKSVQQHPASFHKPLPLLFIGWILQQVDPGRNSPLLWDANRPWKTEEGRKYGEENGAHRCKLYFWEILSTSRWRGEGTCKIQNSVLLGKHHLW